MFLGFMLAAISLKLDFQALGNGPAWVFPLLILGVPLFDATLVTISRLRRGLNPFGTPGKDHTAHRLVSLGMTARGAVGVMYAAATALGGVAILLQGLQTKAYFILSSVLMVAFLAFIVLLEYAFTGNRDRLRDSSGKNSLRPEP